MQSANDDYKMCAEQLASALRHSKAHNASTRAQLRILGNINGRCDDLLKEYLKTLRAYYASLERVTT
jgi:hypothetical protein